MSPIAFAPRAAVVACACALAAAVAPAAHADAVHQVAPGESLWQIATVNGLSPATVAAANGLAPDAAVRAGQVVRIPAAGATPAAPAVPSGSASAGAGSPTPTASASGATQGGGSGAGQAGSVVVRAGDTLTAIAGRAGVPVSRLAAYNGLTQSALLPAGRALALPAPGSPVGGPGSAASGAGSSGAASPVASAASPPAAPAAPAAPATASGTRVSGTRVTATQVGSTAAANGVPASLARAIAWQESGFDNGAVSSVGARGVMQVMPGTWRWIDQHLSGRRLDPSSAADNVQAGTLYLQHLLRQTGGDADQAAAAYYQGLASVRTRGLYEDTKRYVENVRALRGRFGG